ncbi:hypothetical protein J2W28_002081 [Variovorax boronicumulans]|uniref:hypothetical protein n=1 Tax=Variovorax boronicumulans TaxID=436515 RepID=UPI0027876F24|nr:hypothetical protein [Variovorax boronicumulans]MDP9990911.1 hypothetical protein [Variovorax boronicumulans]MDQ0002939.1 hypothetical protein [Variovorax boronicumulans]
MNAVKWVAAAVIAVALLVAGFFLWRSGGSSERAETVTETVKANTRIEAKVKSKARSDIKRAGEAGALREQDRDGLDALFQRLSKEAKDAPTAADDRYVLPDERLHVWRAANAGGGPDRGAASAQPDHSTQAAAAAGLGRDSGAGGKPPRGGEGLSQPGFADVPPAGVSAAPNRGL